MAADETEPTIGQILSDLVPTDEFVPWWPPDVFAVVGVLLARSGAYRAVLEDWPPNRGGGSKSPLKVSAVDAKNWASSVAKDAARWRRTISLEHPRTTPRVRVLWNKLISHSDTPISEVHSDIGLSHCLLELNALADEACQGIGIPSPGSEEMDDTEFISQVLLSFRHTACLDVSPKRVRVLPKLHTPQTGLTLRSLSHHLALCPGGAVEPVWRRPMISGPTDNRLNILFVPIPGKVHPSQFHDVKCGKQALPDDFRFFSFEPRDNRNLVGDMRALHREAQRVVGRIDMVLMPEASVTLDQFLGLRKTIVSKKTPFFVAGVVERGGRQCRTSCGRNSWQFSVYDPVGRRRVVQYGQSKHHRWQLTRSQIIQYGLGGVLDPFKTWWEHISVPPRSVEFAAVNDWLTISVLLCEDLARQEPVLEMVRAVGPNLVIALLMDGPQLRSRWSARYATVLADDPGCSVLAVTSIGMAELSKPAGVPHSRVVGLWKDGKSKDLVELDLPQDAKALIISLAVESDGEWTADGRHDNKTSCFPTLAGLHPVR